MSSSDRSIGYGEFNDGADGGRMQSAWELV